MKYTWIGIALLSLLGCQNYAELELQKNIYVIKDSKEKLARIDELEWDAGYPRHATLSRGITLRVTVPKIREEDAKTLYDKHKIDAWVIRVKRLTDLRSETFGYVSMPIVFKSWGRDESVGDVFVQVLYASAIASARVKSMNCPIFGHRKRIRATDIVSTNVPSRDIVVTFNQVLTEPVAQTRIVPVEWNGGDSLTGRYIAEFALYSTENKTTYSEFLPVDGEALVGREEEIELEDCKGKEAEFVTPPEERERENGTEREKKVFKFGR